MHPQQLLLPDLLGVCPTSWKIDMNPHYKQAGADSSAWINSYNVFVDLKKAYFMQSYNELLAAHAYSYTGYEQFRICCDFINLLFVYDEVSDEQSGEDARASGNSFLGAMHDPEFDDGSKLCEITRDFRKRYMSVAGPNSARRFLGHCDRYVECVAVEAQLREDGKVLGLDAFIPIRRENSAVRLCYGLIELALGIDLPQEVFNDKTFLETYWPAVDMVWWSNDIYSYPMERNKGIEGNNVVTVFMEERKIDLQAASDIAGEHFKILMDAHLNARKHLPSWGPKIDADVARFVDALGVWVKGNLDWSFKTQRYFGPNFSEVKETLVVPLMSQRVPQELFADSGSESD